MTKLYPQALEVNNNLWQGNVNLNSPSQKGHQQNCQCLFNLMVLVREFDRHVFWWGQNERQFSERSSKKDAIWTTIFELGGATTTYGRILLMKEIPAKKKGCHSLDPAKKISYIWSSYLSTTLPSSFSISIFGRWLGFPSLDMCRNFRFLVEYLSRRFKTKVSDMIKYPTKRVRMPMIE